MSIWLFSASYNDIRMMNSSPTPNDTGAPSVFFNFCDHSSFPRRQRQVTVICANAPLPGTLPDAHHSPTCRTCPS